MRRSLHCLFVLLALVASIAVAVPGYAGADPGNGNNGKIDSRLAAEASSVSPDTNLPVIVTGPAAADAVTNHGGNTKSGLGFVGGVSATVKAKDIAGLASESGVDFVSADVPVAATGTVDPSKLNTIYPLVDGAPAAWSAGLDGTGVGVAVIDSGVRKLDDFNKIIQTPVPGLSLLDDTYGHGTLVAGVLGGQNSKGGYIGIAPRVITYSLNVNRPDGPRSSDVINALQWVFDNAHKNNIRVVNLSLQETVPSSYQQSLLDLAVERLWAAGITVVVAAGNGGIGAVDYAPANDPLALTVGAVDNADTLSTSDDTLASFSASGVTLDGFAKPELLAPGRHIVSTLPSDTTLGQLAPSLNKVASGYVSISGTSFAAPQVAAAAALLFQEHPDWSADNVKWLLTRVAQAVSGSSAGALAIAPATAFSGSPSLSNQGVPALVCAPGSTCIVGGTFGTVSSSWNSSSWNSSSWNSSSWNSSSWNSSSWNSSSWNSSSWNSSSWNSSSWNSSSWNSFSWN